MSLETTRDLFLHELSDLVSAEHIFHKVLGEMAEMSDHADAKKAYSSHQKETKVQIDRLMKAFEMMGETPEKITCEAAAGLQKEHESLKEEKPEGIVKELGLLMGAGKSEHYEIASYRMLAQVARSLGESDVADLLSQTLAEEEEAEKKAREIARSMNSEIRVEAEA